MFSMPSSEVGFIQAVGNLRCIARQCIKSFEGQRGIQANSPLYSTGIHNVTDIICLSMLSVNDHIPLHVKVSLHCVYTPLNELMYCMIIGHSSKYFRCLLVLCTPSITMATPKTGWCGVMVT